MRRTYKAGLGLAFLLIITMLGQVACAQSQVKSIVVQPTQDASGKQQLELKGIKASSEAAGVRIFVDPGTESKLGPQSKSYVGSFYFTHQESGNQKEGSFVVVLDRKVSGPTRVVLYPISTKGSPLDGAVEVREARIRPADNSSFQ
jgi:hypothetical protein